MLLPDIENSNMHVGNVATSYSLLIVLINYVLLQITFDGFINTLVHGAAALSIIRTSMMICIYRVRNKYPSIKDGISRALNFDIFNFIIQSWYVVFFQIKKSKSANKTRKETSLSPVPMITIKIPSPKVLLQLLSSLQKELKSSLKGSQKKES